jgi:hypothetical protein
MVVGGLIVGVLTSSVLNGINNATKFASVRSFQYDATAATDLAIQNIRYTPLLSPLQTLNASPPAPCWGSGSNSQYAAADGNDLAVWCSTLWNPTSVNTRVVTFSTCPVATTASACALNPSLQSVVTFDDYPAGLTEPTTAPCVVYCGTGLTINSWVQLPTIPSVTGLVLTQTPAAPVSGSVNGNTQLTLTGSGFVAGGTTATFVEESGGVPLSANVVLPASPVAVSSSTSMTLSSPSVTVGTTYFVTVTTPAGTSAYGSNIFTYLPLVPTATAIASAFTYSGTVNGTTYSNNPDGSIAGGTPVTVTGTGFSSGATVNFVEESAGVDSSPLVSLPGTSVTVNSNTSLTVLSPAVTVGSTYFVTVTTAAGTSAPVSVPFLYLQFPPTIVSVLPASPNFKGPVAGGTTVTITGVDFFTGATVSFVEESGGTAGSPTVAATGVTVNSATSITAVSPATAAGTYFVEVTTPGGGTSSVNPIFTSS